MASATAAPDAAGACSTVIGRPGITHAVATRTAADTVIHIRQQTIEKEKAS